MLKIREKIKASKNWFLHLSWKKKIFFTLLFVAMLFFASSPLRIKKPQYTTAKVTKSTIIEVVSETGNISVNGRVDVYSPTNGIIKTLSVKNGDQVQKDQELFSTVSTATEQEKQDALSALLLAQSTLGTAQATMYSLQSAMFSAWDDYYQLATNSKYQNSDGSPKTTNRVLPEFSTAQTTWLATEAQYKNQQAVVNQASAALTGAKLKYDATQNATVKAQTDGTISNLSVAVGNSVSAKSSTLTVTPVLAIVSLTTAESVVFLGESDIPKIKEGQSATFTVSAAQDKIYKGVVRRVDSIATAKDGVMKYAVYIEILNPDYNLRPGMTADIDITTKKLENVLSAPNSAVKPYQGGRAVRLPGANGQIKYVPVKIGVRGESRTQILSGIKEGQTVITSLSNEALKRPGLFGN